MKILELFYNSFIWGLVIAITASQNEWLEMRTNTGNFIPETIALIFIIELLINLIKNKKFKLISISFKFTVINTVVCVAAVFIFLGLERALALPASIIREALRCTSLSFTIVNAFILIFICLGLIISYIGEKK